MKDAGVKLSDFEPWCATHFERRFNTAHGPAQLRVHRYWAGAELRVSWEVKFEKEVGDTFDGSFKSEADLRVDLECVEKAAIVMAMDMAKALSNVAAALEAGLKSSR